MTLTATSIFVALHFDLFLVLIRCSARLLTLEKQLEAMYETFDKDRNRVGALEKELKQVREENRALIRVIAKLSRA